MNTEQKSEIRKKLLKERHALIEKLVAHERELELFDSDLPNECENIERYPDGLNRVLTEAGATCSQLACIERAMEMIDEGAYGLCERCGKEIATNKEDALPVLICDECENVGDRPLDPILTIQHNP